MVFLKAVNPPTVPRSRLGRTPWPVPTKTRENPANSPDLSWVVRKNPIAVFSAFAAHLGEPTGEGGPTHSVFYMGLWSVTTETPDSRTGTWITHNVTWHPHKTYRNFINCIQKRHLDVHIHTKNVIITHDMCMSLFQGNL